MQPSDVADGHRRAGPAARAGQQGPVDRIPGDARAVGSPPGADLARDKGARGVDPGDAPIEADLPLGRPPYHDGDDSRPRPRSMKPRGQGDRVADDNIPRGQGARDPEAPYQVQEEVEGKAAGVVETGQPDVPHAGNGLRRRQLGPATRDKGHGVAGRGEDSGESVPCLFGCAAADGGHRKEKAGHNGDFQAGGLRGLALVRPLAPQARKEALPWSSRRCSPAS